MVKRLRIWWAAWRLSAAREALRMPTAPQFRRSVRIHVCQLGRHIQRLEIA